MMVISGRLGMSGMLKMSRETDRHQMIGSPSPSLDISGLRHPKNFVHPQNIAIDHGINLGVVPIPYNTHDHSHHLQTHPQQIY